MCPLIFVVGDHELAQWVAARRLDSRVRSVHFDGVDSAVRAARNEPPRIVIYSTAYRDRNSAEGDEGAESSEDTTVCNRFKGDPGLRSCWLLAVYDRTTEVVPPQETGPGPDDRVDREASALELTQRLQVGLRLYDLETQRARLQQEIDFVQIEQRENNHYLQNTTAELVEMAAQLNAELYQNAALEVEHIRNAQSDVIAQAAAALRHEINNPLFAITGSAETAKRRLGLLAANPGLDLNSLYGCIDRIQRGAARIEQVVQTISNMLVPTTTDYVPGVPMLDLNKTRLKDEG